MAKKADLEAALQRTAATVDEVLRAVAADDYAAVVSIAAGGLTDVWPAVAYQRRYLGIDRPELTIVDALLRYSPPVFARRELDRAREWWATAKRSDKMAYDQLPKAIESARNAMGLAARVWDEVDAPAGRRSDPADGSLIQSVLDIWTRMGIVAHFQVDGRAAYRHVTRASGLVGGKCAECGAAIQARLADSMDGIRCRHCRRTVEMVVTRRLL